MPPLNSQYTVFKAKTASYTILVGDDVIVFTTSGAGVIATLPLASTCTIVSGQNVKQIINSSGSTDPITVAAQAGNTLVGATTSGATTTTLAAGESAIVNGNQSTVWNISGGDATQGVSGFSGFSGYSGFSGFSGYSGFSGFSGVSGYSGISGFSGYSGFSGKSGYSSFSGFSGYSGFSGVSGYSGYTGV